MASGTPNLVFVFADQLRAEATGCAGNEQVRTPNLDRLADEGVYFPNAYTTDPVCSPARASILTGRYPHNHGVVANGVRLPATERSIARHLGESGYETGYVGKWHLDGDERPGYVPPGPRRHGFEHWYGFNCDHGHLDGHPRFDPDGNVTRVDGYQPEIQTGYAIDFVEEHADDPFCLFLSWGPPHTPFDAPGRYSDLYPEEDVEFRPNVPGSETSVVRGDLAEYYAMVTSLDDNLGRLLDALERLGLEEETIVCFTSDHGEMLGSLGRYRKGTPFEESIHVPLIVRYPDRIEAGLTLDAAVSLCDLAPTLLALCDVPVPDRVDGRDLAPYLTGASTDDLTDGVYVEGKLPWCSAEWRALRTERYLLCIDRLLEVVYLFDTEEDPYQMENLAEREPLPDVAWDLRARLLELAYRYGDGQFVALDVHQDITPAPSVDEINTYEHLYE